jgi:hypothetical protein
MKGKAKTLLASAAAGLLLAPSLTSAAVLADWTFETSVPTTSGPHVAEAGINAASSQASSNTGGTFSNPAGNGSTESFSSNGWNVNEYWQFTTDTSGYQGISLTFDATGSNTGPRDFKISYSTDGVTFSDLTTYTLTNDSWSTVTANPVSTKGPFTFAGALDNDSSIFIRLIDTSTTAVTGGTVASTGTSRIDNVVIQGTAIPEPATLGLALFGGGGFLLHRRRITV